MKSAVLSCSIVLLLTITSSAQNSTPPLPPPIKSAPCYTVAEKDTTYGLQCAEVLPEYPGGEDAMLRYLGQTLKYPNLAKELGVSGKVFVEFVIDKLGNVTNVTLKKGVKAIAPKEETQEEYDEASYLLNQEAMRAVSSMQPWNPGSQQGKPIRVRYIIPINFKLK